MAGFALVKPEADVFMLTCVLYFRFYNFAKVEIDFPMCLLYVVVRFHLFG